MYYSHCSDLKHGAEREFNEIASKASNEDKAVSTSSTVINTLALTHKVINKAYLFFYYCVYLEHPFDRQNTIDNDSSTCSSPTTSSSTSYEELNMIDELSSTTPRLDKTSEDSQMPFPTIANQLLYLTQLIIHWIVHAVLLPVLSWSTVPIVVYFLLMGNFEFITYTIMYTSEANFFNYVDFTIIPRIDRLLFFDMAMPHELLAKLYHPILDVFFAIPYLNHFIFPTAFYPIIICVLLWKPNREFIKYNILPHILVLFGAKKQVEKPRAKMNVSLSSFKLKSYLFSLGCISMIQMMLCLFFPTAPPWFRSNIIQGDAYFEQFGNHLSANPPPVMSIFSPEARFEMVDELIGYDLFEGIYGQGTIKFGSFFSLHVGWTAIITFIELFIILPEDEENTSTSNEELPISQQEGCFTFLKDVYFGNRQSNWTWFQIFMLEYLVWILIASIYSAHHYLIDGLVGMALAFVIVKYLTPVVIKLPKPKCKANPEV